MNLNADKIIGGMFSLILIFLLLSRADQFNIVISAIGGFVTNQTRALQGLTPNNVLGSPQNSMVR